VGKKGNCWPELLEFLITLGEQMREKNRRLCAEFSGHAKRARRIARWSSIPLSSHQGEREKNEYLYDGKNTGELPESKQIKL
jgi:hypothetical protein